MNYKINGATKAAPEKMNKPITDRCKDLRSDMATTEPRRDGLMRVYWIGCAGLACAAGKIGPEARIDRIGCSVEKNLADRLSTAAADGYGSWRRDESGSFVQESGFDQWVMQAIKTIRAPRHASIKVRTRTIEVEMPSNMTRRQFDAALRRALDPWSLAKVHPASTRFTHYSVGIDRMSCALELYTGLDPRRDGDRLLGLVEEIIDRHEANLMPASCQQPDLVPALSPKQSAPHQRLSRMSSSQFKAMRARQWRERRRRAP